MVAQTVSHTERYSQCDARHKPSKGQCAQLMQPLSNPKCMRFCDARMCLSFIAHYTAKHLKDRAALLKDSTHTHAPYRLALKWSYRLALQTYPTDAP